MAASDNPPDFDPRHRIVGAIIIVLLVVVFVPLLLGDPEELSQHAIRLKQSDGQLTENGVRRYVTRLDENSTPAPVRETSADPSPVPATKPARHKTPAAAKWEVRIGTFSKADNARNLVKALKRLKFRVRSSKTAKGYTRVWMGVYDSESEARKVVRKLDTLAKVKAIVVKQE